MGTAQQEIPVAKVYIVMLSEPCLLESGTWWENIVVSGVYMSRSAADEYIDYITDGNHQFLLSGERYSIREELVRS